jgi:hypothetical protein
VWWQPVKRSKKRKFLLAAAVATPTLAVIGLVIALMLAQAADDRAGCGSVDPTDPANYSSIVIHNDSSKPVVIADCVGGYCKGYRLPVQLAPDASFNDDASGASDQVGREGHDIVACHQRGRQAVGLHRRGHSAKT